MVRRRLLLFLGALLDGRAHVPYCFLFLRHLQFSPPVTCLHSRPIASCNGWITHDQLRQNYPVVWVDSIGGIIRVCSRRYAPVTIWDESVAGSQSTRSGGAGDEGLEAGHGRAIVVEQLLNRLINELSHCHTLGERVGLVMLLQLLAQSSHV